MNSPTRRDFLATTSSLLGASLLPPGQERVDSCPLDEVYGLHAGLLPEAIGTNHFPMAAEALVALGRPEAVQPLVRRYRGEFDGELPRRGAIVAGEGWRAALGSMDRLGDWRDLFDARLARDGWRGTLRAWVDRLAPGMTGAAFHGLIRTAHAVRALRRGESGARRSELAAGLSYWAARYLELPETDVPREPGADFFEGFRALEYPWPDEEPPVGYFSAPGPRLAGVEPFVPALAPAPDGRSPRRVLDELVAASARVFLEMARLDRFPIVLLHAVTGPAAVGLLLPEVDGRSGHRLVERAWQGAAAVYASYGVRPEGTDVEGVPWKAVLDRAVGSGDAHAIKLAEAMHRESAAGDAVHVAAAWEWVRRF